MAVTVVIVRGGGGGVSTKDVYEGGDSFKITSDGHLLVVDEPGYPLAAYAPGQWFQAFKDDSATINA